MAINLKTKVKPVEVEAEAVSPYASDIDKIGALMAEADELEKSLSKAVVDKLAKINALRKEAKAKTSALAATITEDHREVFEADKTFTEKGEEYVAELGKQGMSRTIMSMAEAKKILDKQDKTLFLKLAKINLGDLDAYLTPDEAKAVIRTDYGDRSIKIVKKVI